MKFSLGSVVATPAALEALNKAGVLPMVLLNRHGLGDWGSVCKDDATANDDAIRNSDRVLSAYSYGGYEFYVITEHDRSSTCVMLKSDY